jgi:DNA excision repair protein ERCC-2
MNGTDSKPVHTVSVRELIEFVFRRGDLGGEGQFVGSDRALAGIRGHQRIQRSRPAGYQTEIPVEHRIDAGEFILRIRGRIDGLLVTASEVLLEEIKTVQGRWDKTPDPLHWAQAKFYACIYAREHGLSNIAIQLTYLELDAQEVTEFRETASFAELSDFVASTAAIYVEWLREQHFWEQERNRSIRELPFPFPAYRPGQRELAVASYRVLANGGRLFLAAPTGLGKTISVLFPAIKALGEGKLEHVFYLTARTVGRGTAENALAGLRRCGLKLRSVTLTAMEKVCTRNGQPCDPLTCPMRLGYYDRIKPALREALGLQEMNRFALETVARNHQVCPFELSLDASIWADVVICDYNYVFDPQVYLRRFFSEESGDYGFLVDEAHNLVDRAREMFSAELDGQEILDVKRALKRSVPRCVRALTKLHTTLRQAANPAGSEVEAPDPSDPSDELNLFPASAPPTRVGSGNIRTSRDFPESLSAAVEAALIEAERWLVQNQPAPFRDPLLALYFRLRSFQRTAEAFDERYVTIVENGPAARIRLFCLDPSHLLRQALARGGAAVFFSATLAPIDYFCTVLGGMPEDPWMQLASPFPPENLAVLIHDRIQTQFKARAESMGDVVTAIRTVVAGRTGNYLVYFPSYQYLNAVLEAFQSGSGYPSVSVLAQRPGMTESERDSFLAAFSMEHGETLVGFAVLGGIFGEGIDLAGERLIGAVIVGVGLPQMCIERDLIRDYFQQRNVAGFDYAYTYPGMNRVLQSIGRVIRSETDRGVVLLIDARFGEMRYRRLFPAWWKFVRVRHSSGLEEAIAAFWNGRPIAESGNRQR